MGKSRAHLIALCFHVAHNNIIHKYITVASFLMVEEQHFIFSPVSFKVLKYEYNFLRRDVNGFFKCTYPKSERF